LQRAVFIDALIDWWWWWWWCRCRIPSTS